MSLLDKLNAGKTTDVVKAKSPGNLMSKVVVDPLVNTPKPAVVKAQVEPPKRTTKSSIPRVKGKDLTKWWGIWEYPISTSEFEKIRYIAGGFETEEQAVGFFDKYDVPLNGGKIIITCYYDHGLDLRRTVEAENLNS